ncbi:MAG: hypothetical protein Q8K75_12440 [Chlamydiales bacterium]|nr:hypothetical protein [Chlamydiales bacterium]
MTPIQANNEQVHAPSIVECINLLPSYFSPSRILPFIPIPTGITDPYIGTGLILGVSCSLHAVCSSIFPALNSTVIDECIALGSLAFYETLYLADKSVENETQQAELIEIDYTQRRNFGYVEPFELKGSPLVNRSRLFNVPVGSENTVDEVCQWAAKVGGCDPSEILIMTSRYRHSANLTLEQHKGKTIAEAFPEAQEQLVVPAGIVINHSQYLKIDVVLKEAKHASSIVFKGQNLNVKGIRPGNDFGSDNTIEEISREIAIQRECRPQEVIIEVQLDPERWGYFDLEEDKESCGKGLKDVALEKYGLDISTRILQVRIARPKAIKSARAALSACPYNGLLGGSARPR